MFTISIKHFNDYLSQQHTEPTTIQNIKNEILSDPKGKGFFYENLVFVNYHNEIMKDDYTITETTVLRLIIKPIVCQQHPCECNNEHKD